MRKQIKLLAALLFCAAFLPARSQAYEKMYIEKSEYIVFSKNKKTRVTAKFKKVFGKKEYFLKLADNTRIYPEQTDSVFRVFGFDNRDTLKGIRHGKNWLFLTQNGAIKGYARRPVPMILASSYYKRDTLLVRNKNRFRKSLLGIWVAGSPEATALWKKQRRRHFGKAVIAPLIFATCITVSIVAPDDSALSVIAWLSSVPLPLIPICFRSIPTAEVVDAYNASKRVSQKNYFKDE